jgi:hypothetical protein
VSDSFTSGSIPTSQVVAYELAAQLENVDRKLVAELYAMDALWYADQAKNKENRVLKFPVILGGISPIRYLVYAVISRQNTPEETAALGQELFEEFVNKNQDSIGFGGELKFTPRDMSKARLPLALFLELERLARPDRMFEQNPRLPAEIMGVILNSGKGAIDDDIHRPGAEFSVLLSKLCPLSPGSGVLDMSSGTGTLLHKLLTDKSRIRAFGQEMDAELAIISWLRMQLNPSSASAHVQVGDPLRYGYASSFKGNPVDIAVVHSIDLDADEENKASIVQNLREAEETDQRFSHQRSELEYRCELVLKSRNEAKWCF